MVEELVPPPSHVVISHIAEKTHLPPSGEGEGHLKKAAGDRGGSTGLLRKRPKSPEEGLKEPRRPGR